MPALRENAITLLASVDADMQNGDGNTTVYTVPTGFVLYVTNVVVRDPTASLADGVDFDFGSSSGSNFFNTAATDLSGMTTVGTDYYIISNDDTVLTEYAAAALFEVVVNTGATADAVATIDLFGYLVAL